MIPAAVYDTKPYDREHLQQAAEGSGIQWQFWDFRLSEATAATAQGCRAVCVFVNDRLDRPCLEALALAEIARVIVENLAAFDQGRPFLEGTTL